MKDMVTKPSHYYWYGDKLKNSVWEIQLVLAQGDIAIAEVIRYIARRKHKGSELQDLKKACWYLIEQVFETSKDEMEKIETLRFLDKKVKDLNKKLTGKEAISPEFVTEEEAIHDLR